MIRTLIHPWVFWSVATLCASIGLGIGLSGVGDRIHESSQLYLPGRSTDGHYQIELKCSACHDASGTVQEDKCLDCHLAELKESKDTHPKSKFKDPTKIVLLEKIAADNCLTCHKEHDPARTLSMGLTVPDDYCWHCHQDVAKNRPSHTDLAFDTCLNSGCHNYHDNTALYENFLTKHLQEPSLLPKPTVFARNPVNESIESLTIDAADVPENIQPDPSLMTDWLSTSHALRGVNCNACHAPKLDSGKAPWSDSVSMQTCQTCHESQVVTFQQGKHGMRLHSQFSEMTPELARLPMQTDADHTKLNCHACHKAHRYDTTYASVDACLTCHSDQHSQAYLTSSHYELWKQDLSGELEVGTSVSCATCHMPRIQTTSGHVEVMHNQNWNLQPNEKMIRSVCMNCHGLAYTIDALASEVLIQNCFSTPPTAHVQTLDMVERWFAEKQKNLKQ